MNNTTYSIKKDEIERKWYIIDAANKPLGRVAAEAAKLLRGKHNLLIHLSWMLEITLLS